MADFLADVLTRFALVLAKRKRCKKVQYQGQGENLKIVQSGFYGGLIEHAIDRCWDNKTDVCSIGFIEVRMLKC